MVLPKELPARRPASWGPNAASRKARFLPSSFWKMTPPRTTEMEVASWRTKPKVAVARATS